MRAYVCMLAWYVCVKRARTNARVSADREASGIEPIAVAIPPSIRRPTYARVALRSYHVPGRHRGSYESLVVNRSDVMRESINRILFPPFSGLSSLFLSLSLSPFLALPLARTAVSLRERRFSLISRFIHLPEKQPRSDAPLRAAESCVTSRKRFSSFVDL